MHAFERRTDTFLVASPRWHFMQCGKNRETGTEPPFSYSRHHKTQCKCTNLNPMLSGILIHPRIIKQRGRSDFLFPLLPGLQGRIQKARLGGGAFVGEGSSRRRKLRGRDVEIDGAEPRRRRRRGRWGTGVSPSPPQPTRGSGERREPPAGFGAKSRSKTDFNAFQVSQNACRLDVCRKRPIRRHLLMEKP